MVRAERDSVSEPGLVSNLNVVPSEVSIKTLALVYVATVTVNVFTNPGRMKFDSYRIRNLSAFGKELVTVKTVLLVLVHAIVVVANP